MPIVDIDGIRTRVGVQSVPTGTSKVHYSGKCVFYEILIKTDGTNAVTLNIYDSLTATGKMIGNPDMVIAGAENNWTYNPVLPRLCWNGIYIDVSVAGGGTCRVSVEYDPGGVEA